MSLQTILPGDPERHFWEDLTSLQRKNGFFECAAPDYVDSMT